MTSPFYTPFMDLPDIKGLTIYCGNSGIKYRDRHDLLVIKFDSLVNIGGVYTRSSMPSAPVDYCMESHIKKAQAKILCVNAGNANAFTGKYGKITTQIIADHLSKQHNCSPSNIYMASTGVIGEKLDGDIIGKKAVSDCHLANWEDAARAVMTTDTFPKGSGKSTHLSCGKKISASGIAKGSGMIAPNMGTMLAFIFTDAYIPQEYLMQITQKIVKNTFNIITVDGDTSTSDSFQIFATGEKSHKTPPLEDLKIIENMLYNVAHDLALQIVKDGEGISKLLKIQVNEAQSEESARKIGLCIANSPLVKTACAGEDANWGRVVMAIGKSGEPADRDNTSISIGGITIAKLGEAVLNYDENPVTEHMKTNQIDITVSVGIGTSSATIYGADLTHKYIDINADYRS